MVWRGFWLFPALAVLAVAQSTPFPLEKFSVTGTALSKELVLQMSGLKIGAPLNKAAIDEACRKLDATGLFQSINYHYGPAPKHGYALTLTLADFHRMSPAAIDVPGADQDALWRRLMAKYPEFDHKVPENQAAQELLAREIGQMAGAELVIRHEEDLLGHGGSTLVFEPPTLPRVANMTFTGNHELTSQQLAAAMDKVNAEQEYTDRRFRRYVDLNLRRAYEEHGMYRVKFLSLTAKKADDRTVDVNVAIEEGPQYTLGKVEVVGEDLPRKEMLQAGAFKIGQPANWTEIQNGIWAMEKPVKRSGYFDAAAVPERIFDDQHHVLDVTVKVRKGPLYRFGELSITGLSPELEAKARGMWRAHPGDPYDFMYPGEFLREFSKVVDFRQFSKYAAAVAPQPNHVMDVKLEFAPRG
ncbi:MAG TPA: POTRA domain-containing protein [Bryobacteraceae bacterium]|nr:POTRA domain-containing protein [Bryobacteraceae bacterium]